MTRRRAGVEGMLPFIGVYASWVVLVNNAPGPWRQWSRGTQVDAWTLTHVGFGALAYHMGLTLPQIASLGVANEAGEAWIRANRPDLLWGEPETTQNVVVDVLANPGGWLLAEWIENQLE